MKTLRSGWDTLKRNISNQNVFDLLGKMIFSKWMTIRGDESVDRSNEIKTDPPKEQRGER